MPILKVYKTEFSNHCFLCCPGAYQATGHPVWVQDYLYLDKTNSGWEKTESHALGIIRAYNAKQQASVVRATEQIETTTVTARFANGLVKLELRLAALDANVLMQVREQDESLRADGSMGRIVTTLGHMTLRSIDSPLLTANSVWIRGTDRNRDSLLCTFYPTTISTHEYLANVVALVQSIDETPAETEPAGLPRAWKEVVL